MNRVRIDKILTALKVELTTTRLSAIKKTHIIEKIKLLAEFSFKKKK